MKTTENCQDCGKTFEYERFKSKRLYCTDCAKKRRSACSVQCKRKQRAAERLRIAGYREKFKGYLGESVNIRTSPLFERPGKKGKWNKDNI